MKSNKSSVGYSPLPVYASKRAVSSARARFAVTCFIALSSCPSYAADDPSTIIVPYSSSSNRTLGDAVNIAFPYSPLGRCVSYQSTDRVWDTAGAISSDGTLSIASADDQEKNTTNLSLGFQTSAKVNAGLFSANSTFDTDLTTDTFRSSESKTLTLKFTSNADYGRYIIENFNRDPLAPSPTADLVNFRKKCGTHFIRDQRRASDLTILVRIEASTQEGKDALAAHLKQTIGGGVSVKAVSGDAGDTFSASYKSIIEFAKKSGDVSVDYHAHGGPGIAAAGAAARLVDPSDFAKLSDIVSNVSSLFTQDNSGITGYGLLPDTALGAPDVTFDLSRVEQIGALTRQLMMLNNAAGRYDDLKSRFSAIYTTYFQTYADKVNLARAQLVQEINTCAAGGNCTPPASDILRTLSFLEDMFTRADVSLSCQYQLASSVLPVISTPSFDPQVLESVSINLLGNSHNPDVIDFASTHIIRLTADNTIDDVSAQFSGFSLSNPTPGNERRVFGTVYSENINPKTAITYDNSTGKFIVDSAELERRRDKILGSAFSLYAPAGPSGINASYDVGFPPRNGCSPVK